MSRTAAQHASTCVLSAGCELGEGAFWHADDNALWFVDILGGRLHRFHPPTGAHRTWPAPRAPGFLALDDDGRLLAGLADGLYRFDALSGAFAVVTRVGSELPENRLNDGIVGPDRQLWFGSKNELENAPSGVWYRWSGAGAPTTFDRGYVVTNGPAFAPDGRTLYHSNSTAGEVLCRAIASDGELGPNRTFARIEPGAGYPDGLAVDTDGCLWVALWAGAAVRRYDPDGAVMAHIPVDCPNVTKPAFGGPDRSTLYLTTARTGLSQDTLAAHPDAGGLFAIEGAARGLPIPRLAARAPRR